MRLIIFDAFFYFYLPTLHKLKDNLMHSTYFFLVLYHSLILPQFQTKHCVEFYKSRGIYNQCWLKQVELQTSNSFRFIFLHNNVYQRAEIGKGHVYLVPRTQEFGMA